MEEFKKLWGDNWRYFSDNEFSLGETNFNYKGFSIYGFSSWADKAWGITELSFIISDGDNKMRIDNVSSSYFAWYNTLKRVIKNGILAERVQQ
jgi:hypothetical protein